MDALDALRQQWRAHDDRLDAVLKLNRRILRALESGRVRSALDRVARTLWTQLAVDALAVLALGSFVGRRIEAAVAGAGVDWRFLLPGLALFLPAVALLAAVVAQLVEFGALDAAGPVTAIQRRLERLRRRRATIAKAVILACPSLWILVAIVGARGCFGVDLYAWLPLWWMGLNLAIGLALVPALVWASRRLGDRLGHWPAVAYVARELAGSGFHEAQEQLARLAAFESEERGE